ncbi:MAG: ABC transporter ATP-binding protein [Desulfobacteraceae bacterium]|jgi:branched-chain amino acid transport system ATP-binding protein
MAFISDMAKLELVDVSMQFGGIRAITSMSFQVKEGELFAIIGPNGAGKSTIFNCINGIYTPTIGEVFFEGKDITGLKSHKIARRGIARTFQNIALFSNMTVLDNLLLGRNPFLHAGILRGGLFWGRGLHEELRNRGIVEEIIDFLEIEGVRKKIVGSLPFGIQRRVELGRALAMKPKLLLLDEPVSGMNIEETEDMARFILDIKEELDTTIMLVDHDMGVVMDIADRIAVVNFGEKIAEGTPEEISENPLVIQAYLGEEESVSIH